VFLEKTDDVTVWLSNITRSTDSWFAAILLHCALLHWTHHDSN